MHDDSCIDVGWRKSSYSMNNGACIGVGWREAGQSLNAGAFSTGVIAVRDTAQARDPDRTVIDFSARAWAQFTGALKRGL